MDFETQSKLINSYRGSFPMYSDSGERSGNVQCDCGGGFEGRCRSGQWRGNCLPGDQVLPSHVAPPPRPPAAFGLPTTVLAAVLAAQPQGISLLDQRFMLVGAARG